MKLSRLQMGEVRGGGQCTQMLTLAYYYHYMKLKKSPILAFTNRPIPAIVL